MAASSRRLTWRGRLASWLAAPVRVDAAEVERHSHAAEEWAAEAKAARLVRRLEAVRPAPGVRVPGDWRERAGVDQSLDRAGDA